MCSGEMTLVYSRCILMLIIIIIIGLLKYKWTRISDGTNSVLHIKLHDDSRRGNMMKRR